MEGRLVWLTYRAGMDDFGPDLSKHSLTAIREASPLPANTRPPSFWAPACTWYLLWGWTFPFPIFYFL